MSTRTEHISTLIQIRTWPRFVWVCVVVLASAAAVWPAIGALVRVWGEMADYAHGPVIVTISAFWLIGLRRRIEACDVRFVPLALLALAGVLVLWMVAYRANSELMQQLLTPVIMQLAVLAVFGRQVFRVVLLPLVYLYLAIPAWDLFVPLLQSMTASVAETLLGLLGVPTTVEGNYVAIPSGRFVIAEGCSGKRYFIVALATAVAAGGIQRLPLARLTLLIGLSTLAALVTNWLRVVIIMYAGHVSNMQHYLVATDHLSFGYVLFAPLLLTIAVAARRLGQPVPSHGSHEHPHASSAHPSVIGLSTLFALLAAPALVFSASPAMDGRAPLLGPLPVLTGEWQGPLPASSDWRPEFAGHADERRAAYSRASAPVQVYLNAYGAQMQGRELIFHTNSVAPPSGWTVIDELPRVSGVPAMMIAEHLTQERWIIAYTYAIGGRLTSSAGLAQLYYGVQAIWRPAPSGVIAFATPCNAHCERAAEHLTGFWRTRGATLASLIPEEL